MVNGQRSLSIWRFNWCWWRKSTVKEKWLVKSWFFNIYSPKRIFSTEEEEEEEDVASLSPKYRRSARGIYKVYIRYTCGIYTVYMVYNTIYGVYGVYGIWVYSIYKIYKIYKYIYGRYPKFWSGSASRRTEQFLVNAEFGCPENARFSWKIRVYHHKNKIREFLHNMKLYHLFFNDSASTV